MTHETLRRTAQARGGFRARLAALVLAAATLPFGSAAAETYITVSDVPVDVTAQNAAAARDQAIAQAQAKAFAKLVRRLVPNPADQARLRPSQAQIEGFVQDFAVQSERTSTVRYIGRYSVRFRAGRVRQYLAESGIGSVAEVQQVLILPVYQGPNGPLLWEQRNPWRAAWEQGGYGDDPVTLILPNGDTFDTATLQVQAATSGELGALAALIQRYHSAGIVVAVAEPRDSTKGAASGLVVHLATYDLTGAKGTQDLAVDAAPGELPDRVFRKAAASVGQALETNWQQAIATSGSIGLVGEPPPSPETANLEAPGGPGSLYAISMPIAGLADWVKARDQLGGLPGVQHLSLDALTRSGAAFTLAFAGDPVALQTVLAGSGYVLVQTVPAGPGNPGAYQLRRAAPVAANGVQ